MTNKVVLTKEQARAIEELKSKGGRDNLEYIARRKFKNDDFLYGYIPFNTMELDVIAKALLIGYEIEKPKVKIGEWATNPVCNHTFLVYAVTNIRVIRKEDAEFWDSGRISEVRWYPIETTKPSTKEEIFWAELGREVGELKENDLIFTTYHNAYKIINDSEDDSSKNLACLSNAKRWLKEKTITGFYPAESFNFLPQDGE